MGRQIYIVHPTGQGGPCAELNCGHMYCTKERRIVEAVCAICSLPIGFATEFVRGSDASLSHLSCYQPPLIQCCFCEQQISDGQRSTRLPNGKTAHSKCAIQALR